MTFRVLPVEPLADGWTVSDAALASIWRRLVAEERVERTFYAGGIANPESFIGFLKSPHVAACIAIDEEARQPAVLAWLTNVENVSAFAHYCVLGRPSRAAGRAVLSFWESLRNPAGEPLLDLLLGITPEIHQEALRVLHILGFTSIGTIPRYCDCHYLGSRCGGVISYREFARESAAGRS
jgi:hypothetical protein